MKQLSPLQGGAISLIVIGAAATSACQAQNARQFQLDFERAIHSGQTRATVDAVLRGLSVSFEFVGRQDFGGYSATSEPPAAATSALIGGTRVLERTFMTDTFAAVVVFFDRHDEVLLARCEILTAGP